jgi:hypothetical protein
MIVKDGRSELSIPAQNSSANATIADVIGNKTDDHLGNSLFARLDELYDQFQAERFTYPTLAAGAAVVSANTDWTFGAYATVIPASTIANPCHITIVSIESCDRNAVFELQLYQGTSDTVITSARFAVEGGFFGNQLYTVLSAEVPANAQVRARLASSNGTALVATITISVVYFMHT